MLSDVNGVANDQTQHWFKAFKLEIDHAKNPFEAIKPLAIHV